MDTSFHPSLNPEINSKKYEHLCQVKELVGRFHHKKPKQLSYAQFTKYVIIFKMSILIQSFTSHNNQIIDFRYGFYDFVVLNTNVEEFSIQATTL